MNTPEASTLAYVRAVLETLDIAPTALAKLVGVSATTITRPLNDPSHKFTMSTTTIAKIAAATGIDPAPFFSSTGFTDLSMAVLGDRRKSQAPSDLDLTIVLGEINPGVWREPIASISEMKPLGLVSADHPRQECFACLVRGDSLNKIARDGDYLFASRVSKHHKATVNALFIVERLREANRLVELTARVARETSDGLEFAYLTTDSRFSEAIPSSEFVGPSATARIVGRVLYVIRRTLPTDIALLQ